MHSFLRAGSQRLASAFTRRAAPLSRDTDEPGACRPDPATGHPGPDGPDDTSRTFNSSSLLLQAASQRAEVLSPDWPGWSLQFCLDDLAPRNMDSPARAFSRAVHVPHVLLQAPGKAGLELEHTVRQGLAELAAARVDSSSGLTPDLQAMADHLSQLGLQVAHTLPAKPQARAPLTTRSISAPFLVVMRCGPTGAAAPSSDGGSSSRCRDSVEQHHQPQQHQQYEVVVVDAALREHLAVAPSTPAYERALAAYVPELFVGSLARLGELVSSMASAIQQNFASQGVCVPPWRRTQALLTRWSVVEEHERQLLAQVLPQPQAEMQSRRDSVVAGAGGHEVPRAVSEALTVPWQPYFEQEEHEPAAHEDGDGIHKLESQVLSSMSGQRQGQQRHRPAMVIMGFVVAGLAEGGDEGEDGVAAGGAKKPTIRRARDAWGERGPGALTGVCGRVGSSTTSTTSTSSSGSADSEEEVVVMGASPISVFRGKARDVREDRWGKASAAFTPSAV